MEVLDSSPNRSIDFPPDVYYILSYSTAARKLRMRGYVANIGMGLLGVMGKKYKIFKGSSNYPSIIHEKLLF